MARDLFHPLSKFIAFARLGLETSTSGHHLLRDDSASWSHERAWALIPGDGADIYHKNEFLPANSRAPLLHGRYSASSLIRAEGAIAISDGLGMEWDGAAIVSRSTDERGDVQPDRKTFVDRVGISALFHYHAQ
jgi:hypothetical protein